MAVWMMVLPFVGTSLIASGLMPTTNAAGAIVLVICTGDGMVEMVVDPASLDPVAGTADGDEPGTDGASCAWAAAHPPAHLPRLTPLQLPDWRQAADASFPRATVLRAAAATGLPPSTGPPSPL